MNKTLKYISVIFLMLFARGCDFYSTSLWIFQENGIADETNPLTQIFGVGWTGLVLVNIIILVIVSYCYYIYIFKYKVHKNLKIKPETFTDYASVLYYENKNQLWKLLYKVPTNKKAAIAHTGYIAIWAIIFASFMAMTHNLLQFYDNKYYDVYLETIKYPRVIFYTIMLSPLLFLSIKLYKREFAKYKELNSNFEKMRTI